MSNQPPDSIKLQVEDLEIRKSQRRVERSYSDEDRYIALAALDLNSGNVYRTAIALGIPASTLSEWAKARHVRAEDFANGRREKRGDLASKLESLVHTVVEAMPGKVGKATLSQCAVTLGIGVDKLRMLRGEGLEPDPATELCKLLGINRSQLPDRLELQPGEELPEGWSGPIFDVIAELPLNPRYSSKDDNVSQSSVISTVRGLEGADNEPTNGAVADSKLLESLDDENAAN